MQALLAKSVNRRGETLTLVQHLEDTAAAVEQVFRDGSRWREGWVRFFGIPEAEQPRYWKTLRVAALLHDIGKANADFQQAVTKLGSPPQSLRHEHLGALLLCFPSCREWLAQGGVNPDMVTAAVLSHHIKASPATDHPYSWCQSRGHDTVQLHFLHPDVRRVFEQVAACLGVSSLPELPDGNWHAGPPWADVYDEGRQLSQRFRRALNKDLEGRRFLAALKAGLVVADAVASSSAREGKPMSEWLDHCAHRASVEPREIDQAIIKPRARDVTRRTGKPFGLHAFQELAGQEGPRTLLIAPCGAGKTIAAWEWAKCQAKQRRFGRVVFLYPTRGTATEGFRDYVGWAPEGDATLLHGSSAFELAAMSSNPPESLLNKDVSKNEAEARMFALGLWRFRFFSATVDQFLSFMQNRYESMCLLPALSDAAIVLDEVHSYDPTMFELLLSFLREFDVPVLCMTATLSTRRIQQLESVGLTRFPRSEHSASLADLADTAGHPRYRISFEPSGSAAIESGVRAFREGKRVLIVVNRVARCQEVATDIEAALGIRPLVYHSRFRLMDRQQRHSDVVEAFKSTDATIAVTTQVCEMSLDLDAQVLVTEVAPVSALIQRFGRANRHLRDRNALADVIVYPPAKSAPYELDELNLAVSFVQSMSGVATQAQLAEALESDQYANPEAVLNGAGQFLAGGYFAVPGSFRDEDQYSVQCVCDQDLPVVEELYRKGEPMDGYILPAPKARLLTAAGAKLPRHIGVVSSADYSLHYGLMG